MKKDSSISEDTLKKLAQNRLLSDSEAMICRGSGGISQDLVRLIKVRFENSYAIQAYKVIALDKIVRKELLGEHLKNIYFIVN